mgnify:CR=1 FL=1
MKIKLNAFKAALAAAMAIVLLLSCFVFTASAAGYKAGDVVAFGSYPQSRVTDEKLIENLNSLSLSWVSYGYYYGTTHGEDGEMCPGDFMKYADAEYDGKKYRAVILDAYRPDETTGKPSTEEKASKPYKLGTVYWFSYDPVEWIVLDAESGLVLSKLILDAQPFNNYAIGNPDKYNSETGSNLLCFFGDPEMNYYAADYVHSSLRKWLTEDFFETAFSSEESADIFTSAVDNTGYFTLISKSGGEELDFEPTNDKIFLLSYADLYSGDIFESGAEIDSLKKHYFDGDDTLFDEAAGTDYAECQGLYINRNQESSLYGLSTWSLRTAMHSGGIISIGGDAHIRTTDADTGGIRPAMKISLSSKNIAAGKGQEGASSFNITSVVIALATVLAAGAVIAVVVKLKKKKNK